MAPRTTLHRLLRNAIHSNGFGRAVEETKRVIRNPTHSRWTTSSSSPGSDKVVGAQSAIPERLHGRIDLVSRDTSVLDKRPMLTKYSTNCGIFGLADSTSQTPMVERQWNSLLDRGMFYWPVCDILNSNLLPVHHLQGVGPTPTAPLTNWSDLKANQHPFHFQQRRHFVQLRTSLEVADNSGAKRVQCIKVLKGAKPNAAGLGDIIIASVKEALPRGKVKKGEVVTCVVVRAGIHCSRSDGSKIRFDDNAAVIINKSGEPLGTRVFGPVPHELREKNMLKILALAQHVT